MTIDKIGLDCTLDIEVRKQTNKYYYCTTTNKTPFSQYSELEFTQVHRPSLDR
jgi:hypothetical protein